MKNLKIKKEFNRKNLLKILFKSKSFNGVSIKELNFNNKPYIFGTRFNNSVINLEYTINSLKRSFKFIKNLLQNNKKILIIGNNHKLDFFKKHFQFSNNIFFYEKKWKTGLMSNNIIKNEFDLIIFFSNKKNDILLKEVIISKIPTVSILDTEENKKNILYPIFSNNKNIKSLFVLLYLFRKNLII
jgi:ribosomal protein S2